MIITPANVAKKAFQLVGFPTVQVGESLRELSVVVDERHVYNIIAASGEILTAQSTGCSLRRNGERWSAGSFPYCVRAIVLDVVEDKVTNLLQALGL